VFGKLLSRGKACRFICATGFFVFAVSGRLVAIPEDGQAQSDTLVFSAELSSEGKMDRVWAVLGGGLFLPVGKWSDGFDPGISLGGGIDFPLRESLAIGGRFSRIELNMEDRTRISWLTMEAQATYYPPLELSSFDFFVIGRAGLLRATLEVGEGREDEWDLMTGFGGGLLLPISEDFLFQGTTLWRKVLADAQGFSFEGALLFYLF